MQYFKADYLGETNPTYQKLLEKEGIVPDQEESKGKSSQIQQKLHEELMKIKSLDKDLVN